MNSHRLEGLLKESVVRGRVLTSPAQLAGYDTDGLGYKTFRPDAVAIPANVDELIQVVQNSRRYGVPVCIRGAGTSLSGGPVAAQGGVIVHTSALRNVRSINREGFWCEVESGVALNALDEALKPYGVFYPPDPSSGPVCTLGGNVAMNAGGAHCFRYGVTSNYVLGVEAVLLDGSIHRFGGPAGGRGAWREDWKRFMVGSEGTLAAFTRFWLRTLPRPDKVWTLRATYADLVTAERAIHALVAHSSFPVAIELMDPRCVAMVENSPMAVGLPKDSFMLLTEIDGPPELVDARVESVANILKTAGSNDVVFSDDEEQRKKLWKARKAAGGLMGQLSADFVVQDAVIPKSALAELLQLVYDEADAAGLRAVNVFHAGDGNLHPNFLFDSRKPGQLEAVEKIGKRLMQRVVDVGGTLSGEHGIGNDKCAYMPLVFAPREKRIQLAIAAAFNPQHQLNPLKVFTDRRFKQANHLTTDLDEDDHGIIPSQSSRLFKPFLDVIDGVTCVSADANLSEILQVIGSERLRFPFVMDVNASLRDQVNSTDYVPASSRFGPYCDNIIGMNWECPDGQVIRVGERVVKTTTGYDLFRFLLSSGERFGRPVDYVLRLRPDCGETTTFWLKGNANRTLAALPELLKLSWMHWFESVDVLTESRSNEAMLRIVVNCPGDEFSVFEAFVNQFAKSQSLSLEVYRQSGMPLDGLPDISIKTSPDLVVSTAQKLLMLESLRTVILGYSGVIHAYFMGKSLEVSRIRALTEQLEDELFSVGGDWRSRHVVTRNSNRDEQAWITQIEQELKHS